MSKNNTSPPPYRDIPLLLEPAIGHCVSSLPRTYAKYTAATSSSTNHDHLNDLVKFYHRIFRILPELALIVQSLDSKICQSHLTLRLIVNFTCQDTTNPVCIKFRMATRAFGSLVQKEHRQCANHLRDLGPARFLSAPMIPFSEQIDVKHFQKS